MCMERDCGLFVLQQGYAQQDYGSYAQPATTDSAYSQTASAAGGYTQQQYAASYGQSAAPGLSQECELKAMRTACCDLINTYIGLNNLIMGKLCAF